MIRYISGLALVLLALDLFSLACAARTFRTFKFLLLIRPVIFGYRGVAPDEI